VEEGASMVLTSPSANRVHRARDGRGILTQRLETGEGATLLCYPELFIPHAGCRYTQRTEICTHERSICVFAETIAPGRTASGEMFAFEEIQWETVVRAGARLVAMERYRLTPGHPSLRLIRENHSYFGTLFVLSGKQPGSIPALLDTVREVEIALLGASALPGEGCVIRLLAENSIALRKAMVDISGRVLQVLGIPEPELRKL
jgi:urease accessory protein